MSNRAAVISGGGGLIAYWAGWLSVTRPEYNSVYGNSAGATIAIPVAVGEYENIEAIVREQLSNKVWKNHSFTKSGKINYIKAAYRLLTQNGLGDLSPLRDFLDEHLGEPIWDKLQASGKSVKVAVTNMTRSPFYVSFENSIDYHFREVFLDKIYGSCCYWPVAKPAFGKYADGGHLETILVRNAVTDGYSPNNIDVYINRVKPVSEMIDPPTSPLKTWDMFQKSVRHAIEYEDLDFMEANGKINPNNIFYLPYEPLGNRMNFDPVVINKLVERGKEDAEAYLLKKGGL